MRLFLPLFFTFCTCTFCFSQVDSLSQEDESDTIVIIKQPHVVRKTVTVPHVKGRRIAQKPRKPSQVFNSWGINASAYAHHHFAYFDVCEDCVGLFDTIKSSTSIIPGYKISLGVFKRWGKTTLYVNLGMLQYRQRFNFESTTHINRLAYWLGGVDLTYALVDSRMYRAEVGGGFECQINSKVSGYTLAEDKSYTVVELSQTRAFRKIIPVLGISFNNILKVSPRTSVQITTQYRFEAQSNTYTKEPYIEQKHVLLLGAGALVFLK